MVAQRSGGRERRKSDFLREGVGFFIVRREGGDILLRGEIM